MSLQGKKHFKSGVNRNVWEFKLATGVVSSGLFYESILTHRGKFNSWLYGHSLTAVFRVDKLFSAVKVPHGSGAHVGCDIRTNALPYSVIFSESLLTITGIRSPVIPACSWSTSVWCLLTFVYVFSNTNAKIRKDEISEWLVWNACAKGRDHSWWSFSFVRITDHTFLNRIFMHFHQKAHVRCYILRCLELS